eukprot:Ihof_evm1s1384 gene=Ihof_evmTU1s1384
MGLHNPSWMEVVQHFKQYKFCLKYLAKSTHRRTSTIFICTPHLHSQNGGISTSNRREDGIKTTLQKFASITGTILTNKSNPSLIVESKPPCQIHLSSSAPRAQTSLNMVYVMAGK